MEGLSHRDSAQSALDNSRYEPATGSEALEQFTPWDADARLFKAEMQVMDCEVEGEIPSDLAGTFHRVGPDPQFRLLPNNIPFDGDGHASVFRIRDGRVDFRSRYVQTERYVAQDTARRPLFPMYRNPSMDDPSVKGLSRSTANTHIVPFRDMMLALKEDSVPTALDPFSLETLEANYTFDGTLPSHTFTAHPKFDSHTGNLVAFGYEADGDKTDTISIFEYNQSGELVWNVKIKAPYISLLHDVAVTENFIAFFVQPMTLDEALMKKGGIRWSWDAAQPSYFGCVRRGGDGSDLQWVKGPPRGLFHIMGAFDDNERVYVDAPVALGNMLPFIPMKEGIWSPEASKSRLTRISMDMSGPRASSFEMEQLYDICGELPRQDDRYNTVPYRYGFQASTEPDAVNTWEFTQYCRFDHHTKKVQTYRAEPGVALYEPVFAPKNANAREGEGYLLGVGVHTDQGGLADLLVLDAEHIEDGPVATVKMPAAIAPQIHSWWTPRT